MLEPLIKNTLMSVMHQSVKLKTFVEQEMKNPHCAGVYANFLHRPSNIRPAGSLMPVPIPHRGRGLDADQTAELCDVVEEYLRPTATGNQLSLQMDALIPPKTAYQRQKAVDPYQRRYASKSWDIWLDRTRMFYVSSVSQMEPKIPFVRAPTEVDYSQYIDKRWSKHVDNSGTNPIFGLVNAWVRKRVDPPIPGPTQLVVFPVWKLDFDLLSLAKIVTSILLSAYFDEAGLNPVRAGGATDRWDRVIQANDPMFDRWAERLFKGRKHVLDAINADYEREAGWLRTYQKMDDIGKLEKEVEHAVEEVAASKQRLNDQLQALGQAKRRLEMINERKLQMLEEKKRSDERMKAMVELDALALRANAQRSRREKVQQLAFKQLKTPLRERREIEEEYRDEVATLIDKMRKSVWR